MADDRMLKVSDVATRLNIGEETVRRWLRSGKLHGIKLGETSAGYRVPESEVERLLSGDDHTD